MFPAFLRVGLNSDLNEMTPESQRSENTEVTPEAKSWGLGTVLGKGDAAAFFPTLTYHLSPSSTSSSPPTLTVTFPRAGEREGSRSRAAAATSGCPPWRGTSTKALWISSRVDHQRETSRVTCLHNWDSSRHNPSLASASYDCISKKHFKSNLQTVRQEPVQLEWILYH